MNLDKLHTLDRIVLDKKGFEKMGKWYDTQTEPSKTLDIPFYEGIIVHPMHDIDADDIQKYNESPVFDIKVPDNDKSTFLKEFQTKEMHTYFHLKENGRFTGMQLEYDKTKKQYEPMLSFTCDAHTFQANPHFTVHSHFSKVKVPKGLMEQQAQQAFQFVLTTLHFIGNVQDKVTVSEHRVTRSKKGKAKGGKVGKRRIVNVTVKSYSFSSYDSDSNLERRTYARKIDESWRVRGHWRYYKETGKRVWIQPYVKGQGAVQPKDYKI